RELSIHACAALGCERRAERDACGDGPVSLVDQLKERRDPLAVARRSADGREGMREGARRQNAADRRRHDLRVWRKSSDETDAVGETGMIRYEEDRTTSRYAFETRDVDRRRKVIQRPARRLGEGSRGEHLIAGGELSRDAPRHGTEQRPRERTTGSAVLPAER